MEVTQYNQSVSCTTETAFPSPPEAKVFPSEVAQPTFSWGIDGKKKKLPSLLHPRYIDSSIPLGATINIVQVGVAE